MKNPTSGSAFRLRWKKQLPWPSHSRLPARPQQKTHGAFSLNISRGTLWTGAAWGTGLYRYSDRQWREYAKASSGFPGMTIRTLMPTGKATLSVAMNNGIARFSHGSWRMPEALEALEDVGITALAAGGDGSLWIGPFGQGLYRLCPGPRTVSSCSGPD